MIRRFNLVIASLLLLFSVEAVAQQAKMSFRADGTFIISLFNDLHVTTSKAEDTARTWATITHVIEQECPDMAVFNGDVITGKDAVEGWKQLIAVMEQCEMPFVVTMGNHDPEVMTRTEIYDLLLQSPYYIGERGEDELTGMGNFVLPIYDNAGGITTALYFIDSNDYHPNKFISNYDWIHFDQIAWYRAESQKQTEINGGTPMNALMFFHIPLPEFLLVRQDQSNFGVANEGVASTAINSGLFASLLDMEDVMGVFCGHDHDNDNIGIYREVALGFGRVSGYTAYGDLVRGGRMIKLYKGERKFDTWITTDNGREGTYYYPSGLSSVEEESATYHAALDVAPTEQGIAYTYYEGKMKRTDQITEDKRVAEGTMENFRIDLYEPKDHFAYKYRTFIKVPVRGLYKFYTYSDDGSVLYINGEKVVDNDGGHSARRRDGKIALEAGFHLLEIDYFEDYMGETLEVGISSRHFYEQTIPADWLYLPAR